MALSKEMKREIIEYLLVFSKGLIESTDLVSPAYFAKEITQKELEEFVDGCREELLAQLDKTDNAKSESSG